MTFLLKRLAQGVTIVFLTTTLTFVLIHAAPGEPFAGLMGDPRASEALREVQRARYGLDRPLGVQYARFLSTVARGDLGESFTYHRPVLEVLRVAMPRTLLLMGVALVMGFGAGILLGALQGARPGSLFDRLSGGAAIILAAIPDFSLALLALLLFSSVLRVLPVTGMVDPRLPAGATFVTLVLDRLAHLVLPAGTLSLLVAATLSRYQRAAMIEVLPEAYVRTAFAKGVPRRRVIFRHALRNALLPIITLGGLAVPTLLGGAVFVEVVFGWQGMGSLAAGAVGDRDYPLILGIVLVAGVMVVTGGLVADLVQALADPRQRHA